MNTTTQRAITIGLLLLGLGVGIMTGAPFLTRLFGIFLVVYLIIAAMAALGDSGEPRL